MTTKEKNIPNHTNPGVRRYTRLITQTKSYTPSMPGNRYVYDDAQMAEQDVLYPYSHVFFNHGEVQNEPDVTTVIMTQISLKAGLKKWGNKVRGAVHSDMNQLHMRDTFIPLNRKELTEEQRNTILEYHLFLKYKRDGTLKERVVAGGNKKRYFIYK